MLATVYLTENERLSSKKETKSEASHTCLAYASAAAAVGDDAMYEPSTQFDFDQRKIDKNETLIRFVVVAVAVLGCADGAFAPDVGASRYACSGDAIELSLKTTHVTTTCNVCLRQVVAQPSQAGRVYDTFVQSRTKTNQQSHDYLRRTQQHRWIVFLSTLFERIAHR